MQPTSGAPPAEELDTPRNRTERVCCGCARVGNVKEGELHEHWPCSPMRGLWSRECKQNEHRLRRNICQRPETSREREGYNAHSGDCGGSIATEDVIHEEEKED
ncbi:unnamed protein product [Prorocentrum cordatum]|uniref:Uncharacterized protein n=1 Tax=Prorocentrum cordatum TaxID=2364126 RepID=A0ABN9PBX9_9DINO|nr:unnamed protein product [Polarella glacialis]